MNAQLDTEVVFHHYRLHTCDDGTIEGICETNDDLDWGYPSDYDSWLVTFRNVREMRRRTGLTHTQPNGNRVKVYLDHRLLLPEPDVVPQRRSGKVTSHDASEKSNRGAND